MIDRKIFSLLTGLLLFIGLAATSQATLIDNGDGTITQIRIDGSRLMWLKDANTAKTSGYDADGNMSWVEANAWIDFLNSTNYLGYNDWRLPDTNPVNGVAYDYQGSTDGSSDIGYNLSAPGTVYEGSTGSEMAYMFYCEFEELGYYDTSGSAPQPGFEYNTTYLFTNLKNNLYNYWSGTEYAPDPNDAWVFNFYYGMQRHDYRGFSGSAWAVRDLAAPEPTSLLLLGSGLVGIVTLKRKKH